MAAVAARGEISHLPGLCQNLTGLALKLKLLQNWQSLFAHFCSLGIISAWGFYEIQ